MTVTDTSISAAGEAEKGFSRSIIISGVRCVLTYVVLPFLIVPVIGLSSGIGPVLGLSLGTVAIASNVFSIRRFWRANHKWKVHATVLHVGVLILLAVLMVLDIQQLAG